MRIQISQINPIVGNLEYNLDKITYAVREARSNGADIVLFPELALTGYPPDDLLLLPNFIDSIHYTLQELAKSSYGITIIVGTPRPSKLRTGKPLHNSAAVLSEGKILGFHDKLLLPTYDVFDERRYFAPGLHMLIWNIKDYSVGITVCEDIWQFGEKLVSDRYSHDPIKELLQAGKQIDLLVNLSASPYSVGKNTIRSETVQRAAIALKCPLVLCNQVGGNDSLLFDGRSIVVNKEGKLVFQAKAFEEELAIVDIGNLPSEPYHPKVDVLEDLYKALVMGIKDYFRKENFKKACIGLSGGIDSALVACLAVEALGKDNVVGVRMPSRFSSQGSLDDAEQLAQNLGIELLTIPIEEPFNAYLRLLEPHFNGKEPDVTEENLQARIRGMILMALSNKFGYIVLSTGNKSELAMGYCTLYGDMCGGLSVISDLSKSRVYALSDWINRNQEIIPKNTLTKPPSAELRPNQKDSDSLPDYDIIDTVLEQYLEFHHSPEKICKEFHYPSHIVNDIVRRLHLAEYKRRQSPPGLRVTDKSFTIGRRFPIVQGWVK